MAINWDDFEGSARYIKFQAGRPKDLVIQSAEQGVSEIPKPDGSVKPVPALNCYISEEDGQVCAKQLTVTSKRLARALKPFITTGLPIRLQITQFGQKFDIEYEVKRI